MLKSGAFSLPPFFTPPLALAALFRSATCNRVGTSSRICHFPCGRYQFSLRASGKGSVWFCKHNWHTQIFLFPCLPTKRSKLSTTEHKVGWNTQINPKAAGGRPYSLHQGVNPAIPHCTAAAPWVRRCLGCAKCFPRSTAVGIRGLSNFWSLREAQPQSGCSALLQQCMLTE